MADTPASTAPRRRPVPVTILAILQILTALQLAIVAALLVVGTGIVGAGSELVAEAAGIALITVAEAVLEVAAAIALLRLRRIGWVLTMLLAGSSLATAIGTWLLTGEIDTPAMLLGVVTVLYLNQRQVRAAFAVDDGRGADLEEARG